MCPVQGSNPSLLVFKYNYSSLGYQWKLVKPEKKIKHIIKLVLHKLPDEDALWEQT